MTDIGASVGASERDELLRAAWRATAAGEAGIDAGRASGVPVVPGACLAAIEKAVVAGGIL